VEKSKSNPRVEQEAFSRRLQKRDLDIHSQWGSGASSKTVAGFVEWFDPPRAGSVPVLAFFLYFTKLKRVTTVDVCLFGLVYSPRRDVF
jgi:hypothetical protein